MITTKTAEEIVNKNQSLANAEFCMKYFDVCKGVLTVKTPDKSVETMVFDNIQGWDIKNILESVIDGIKARLDELNEIAIKEAQDE